MNNLVWIVLLLIILGFAMTSGVKTEAFRRHHRHGGHRRHRGYGWRNWRPSYRPFPWYYYGGVCKSGCTAIGNGGWGCQYPGTGPNDCWFASDCYWCGGRGWF